MSQPSSGWRVPYLPIRIQVGKSPAIEQEIELEALVNTGFDGGAAVPKDAIDPSISPDTHLIWTLADDTGNNTSCSSVLAS